MSPRSRGRYPTLDSLADDIRRYIYGHPVLARPQTALYLVAKFVRRRRKAVAAASIFFVVVLASLGYAEWRQEQAVLEGQRALRMQTFLYRLLYLANSNYTGKPTFTVPDFLQLGVKLLPDYIKNPADLRKAQMSLAESMYENNDLANAEKVFMQIIPSARAAGDFDTEAESEATCGDVAYLLGQTALGLQLTTHALELSRKAGISPSVRIWSAVYYATNRDRLGFRTDETFQLLEDAAKASRKPGVLPQREMADVLYSLGWDLKLRERYAEAEPVFNEALAIYGQDPLAQCDQSAVYGELAFLKDIRGDIPASLPMYRRAYDGEKACSGAESRGALEQQDRLAGALIKLGRAQQALPILEEALPAWRTIAGSSPDLAEPLSYLSRAYIDTGRYTDAEKTAKESFTVQDGKVSPTDRRIGDAQLLWAQALAGQHHYLEALPHAEIAAKLLIRGTSSDAQQMDSKARQILLDLQTKTH